MSKSQEKDSSKRAKVYILKTLCVC